MLKNYQAAPTLLAGRNVLITGAGTDFGRTATLACAAHGATVLMLDRDNRVLEKIYDEVVSLGAPEPAAIPFDLAKTTLDRCHELAHTVDTEFGRLDGLLHTATESGTLTPLEHYEPAVWENVIQTNLNARWVLTRALLPLLHKSPDASIVFSSAAVGRKGRAYWGAYGVAAFANEGLMQILAAETSAGTPIRVNSLDPGVVRTIERSRFFPGENAAVLPAPESVMPAYLFLLGPDSRGVTGQALNADGPLPATAA
jgi:NAD(P)-dependent dehydrogenase (short-subunit alcohol dehydrogenase family)